MSKLTDHQRDILFALYDFGNLTVEGLTKLLGVERVTPVGLVRRGLIERCNPRGEPVCYNLTPDGAALVRKLGDDPQRSDDLA